MSTVGTCAAHKYTIGRQYSRVCGRVIGYQVASPDAFFSNGGTVLSQTKAIQMV